MSYSKSNEYLSWSKRLLFRDFDTSSSYFISYFHRHLLSFCVVSVFEFFFFQKTSHHKINSTIPVKTWKFIFLFFSEVSPLRWYYLNLDIKLTSYLITKSDLWQRMKQAILIAVLITKTRVNIEKSRKRSHLFWSYSIFCTWQSLHSFAMTIIQKPVEVRCVLEWLMTATSVRKSRMYYMIAWIFEKENCL